MIDRNISEIVMGVIGYMVGFAVGCITMLRNCQKYPDRYQIRNDESEVQDDDERRQNPADDG